MGDRYILTLSCKDVRGIVASVSGFIARNDGFIIESAQYGDASTCRFFLRMEFEAGEQSPPKMDLMRRFAMEVAEPFHMEWQMVDKGYRPKVLIMVSKFGHCLNDLMHRYKTGALPMDIAAVVSNHPDFEEMVKWYGIPFYYFPVLQGEKQAQEMQVLNVIRNLGVEIVVLARYMQVLSENMCEVLKGKAINIHHSFLPSFKGAKPYHQAYDRGVKLIGATAHYVNTDLDEGPIIEQEVSRVDHTHGPEQLVALGRDIECLVLARALKYHIEQRVLLNGNKTVVFR
jgi:formyltetrahydrofolate deformylase